MPRVPAHLREHALGICLTKGDGQIHVYRRRNECYTEDCTLERGWFGVGGSIMVWGGVSQHHQTELVVIATLCVTGKTSSSFMWNPSCRLILTWPSSMTMQPAVLLVLCVISCKTGMSVFCHGQRRARISIPLSTIGTCCIGGWGLGPFSPDMSGNLQVLWWKSGVTSHCKIWQIWCSPWGGDALQYLM